MTIENNNYTIYCHRNMINNKAYIGQTCLSVEDRWKKGTHYKTCTAFNRAIEKYGWDNFEHFIIMEHLTQEQANHYEELLIVLFNTRAPNGYNLDAGGNNHHHSPETIERIREKALGRKLSEETKQKISAKVSGKNNPRAKKVLCIETQQVFNTAKEAGAWVNRDYSIICKVCNGKLNTCGGYHWQYI